MDDDIDQALMGVLGDIDQDLMMDDTGDTNKPAAAPNLSKGLA